MKSRINGTEEHVSDLEDRIMEIPIRTIDRQKQKTNATYETSGGNIKHTYICIKRDSRRERDTEEDKGTEGQLGIILDQLVSQHRRAPG